MKKMADTYGNLVAYAMRPDSRYCVLYCFNEFSPGFEVTMSLVNS